MASPNLGSISGGMMDATLDLQSIQMNQYKLQEAPIKLQEEQIALQQDKMELQQKTKLLSLMQNIKPPRDVSTTDAVADVYTQMAMAELQAGNPEASLKMANGASELLNRASSVDARTYRMQNDRLSKFANILSQSPDSQQGFTQAIQAMLAADPGVARDPKFQALAKQGWQPGLIPKLERSVLSAKDQAEIDYKQKQELHLTTEDAVGRANIGLINARKKHIEDTDAAKAKEGGIVVKAADRNLILKMAEAKWPGADSNDLYVRSQAVAEEMVKMRKDQHLTDSEAGARAFTASEKDGRWKGLKMAPVRAGTSAAKPLPFAKGDTPEPNMWYSYKGEPVWQSPVDGMAYSQEELEGMEEDERAEIGYGVKQ
jgi:hypothetical protein